MKDTIKIALLAIIAGTLIIQTLGGSKEGSSGTPAVAANQMASATQVAAPPTKTTFDPTVPPSPANAPVPTGPSTSVQFPVMAHDFGKVKQNSENTYVFKFTNTGKEPLLISDAKGSCGCTVPEYPKEPIAPGKVGEIKVVYKPGGQQGSQSKTVTVTANTNPPQTLLNISADVQVDPSAAPMAVPTH
ncbi:MAG: DUF1573 domain-containing protein [Bacteroidetes bacterium]|jgi:hypothetical protein|nr:DUF1573 domain-containing protein [Bacteroidota bacterium]MCC6655449.1 DUF1573 domain-containing protein [Flavobacteriales bacterium]HMU15780.1 DUF1573 domain-containing protein [Flavobacteriales bacterium]HMW98504.1 DUF1573 domain-containing protein [Flavobacteriales bacterium]HNE80083.1 DUF1573 domain-containing protein [Flavobacteriales bacterium]